MRSLAQTPADAADPADAAGGALGHASRRENARGPAAGARGGAVDLDAMLAAFARAHGGMRQRDARWYAAMGSTVGGSELAALMGLSPYSGFHDVVANKVAVRRGVDNWGGGGEACWWGTLFEDVVCAYVAADLGAPVRGDDICVRAAAGHRNSPDGYVAARVYRGADGAWHLWTTDRPAGTPTEGRALLLEFKCPLSRRPTGGVPRHYTPQVWSGLAVSPVAHLGLFVDAVFRKCGLLDLGDAPEYDRAFHRRDVDAGAGAASDVGPWAAPVAWGFFAVYAPRLDAPRRVRLGWRADAWAEGDPSPDAPDADASLAAYEIHAQYFGLRPAPDVADLADLGDMEPRLFGRALGLVSRGRFPTRATPPCFADGRGAPLRGAGLRAAVEDARAAAPPHHWCLGLFPWKLFQVDYVPVDRRPGFLDEVRPLIDAVHLAADEALAAADPDAHLAAARRASAPPPRAPDDDAVQSLFDSVAT